LSGLQQQPCAKSGRCSSRGVLAKSEGQLAYPMNALSRYWIQVKNPLYKPEFACNQNFHEIKNIK